MAISARACVLLLLIGVFQTKMASSVRSQDRRKENARLSDLELIRPRKMEEDASLENICDLQAAVSIYCYCDSLSPSDATTASCYVFNETDSTSPWLHFRSQPNLTELTLNLRPQGKLETIPLTALQELQNLKKFKVAGAEIEYINNDSFPRLEFLTELDLADNQIETIQTNSFVSTRNLKSLFLNDNSLTVLRRGQFSSLLKLEMLLLNSNTISLVNDGAFADLQNLMELNLEKNNISVVTTETFQGLSSLQTLLLQKNSLQVIADDTFVHLPQLKRLNLRSNQIEILSQRAFHGLSELQDLNLQENQIHQVGQSTWKGLSALFYLNLRDNKMSTVNETTFNPIWDNLVNESMSFFIEGNPLECSCRVRWLKDLRNSSQSVALQSSLDSLLCEKQQHNLMEFLEATCFESSTTTDAQQTTILSTTTTTAAATTTKTTTTEAMVTSPMSPSTASQNTTSGSTIPAETATLPATPLSTAAVSEPARTTAATLHSVNRDSKDLWSDSRNHDDFLQKDAVVLPEPTAVTEKNSNQATSGAKMEQNTSSAATCSQTSLTWVRFLFFSLFCVACISV